MQLDELKNNIETMGSAALQAISACDDLKQLEDLRLQYCGKKGELTQHLKSMGKLDAAERPKIGEVANVVKTNIQSAIAERQALLKSAAMQEKLAEEKIDVTLPGRGDDIGGCHPVSIVRRKLEDIFNKMGFLTAEGPEIEDDYHNFQALNVPPDHPARSMQDTFYLQNEGLLRTQTSPVQIRTMKNHKPPLRIITPGRVYRCDSDQTHTPMFHQMEGLVVDKSASLAELKSLLKTVFERFWGEALNFRFRPSYFPFTEPSMELDIQHPRQPGQWLEVLGSGCVHPNVLREVGLDPDVYQGYAFGLGLDRIAMLYFDIPDLRLLFEGDWRLLSQFKSDGVK